MRKNNDDNRHDQRADRLAALLHSAYRIRRNALDMGEVQGQGYIGQALGVADILAVVYMDQLRYRADDPHWEGRDRFLLSIGHYAIALYATLAEAGIIMQTYWAPNPSPISGRPSAGTPYVLTATTSRHSWRDLKS